MPRVRVCVNVRVCAFFPFALIPGCGGLFVARGCRLCCLERKLARLLRPLSLLSPRCVQRKSLDKLLFIVLLAF